MKACIFNRPSTARAISSRPNRRLRSKKRSAPTSRWFWTMWSRLPATYDDTARSMRRSVAWAQRAANARTRDDQAVFGIVQGGLHADLRREACQATTEIGFDGYAIGGLSVGEGFDEMVPMIETCTQNLPFERTALSDGRGHAARFTSGRRAGRRYVRLRLSDAVGAPSHGADQRGQIEYAERAFQNRCAAVR